MLGISEVGNLALGSTIEWSDLCTSFQGGGSGTLKTTQVLGNGIDKMSFNSQKNRGTSVFRRKDAPIAPGNGFDHNKKRMNASNPPTAPRSFQDAPGINSGYNKKRNNWSDSSAAPGASSALGGSSTAPGRSYIASGNSTIAPGGFNGAPGTDFDYNKKRNNRSNGNQRNQVPYQNRNQNTGYNNKRNNGPNNGVRSGNIVSSPVLAFDRRLGTNLKKMDARNGNRSNQVYHSGHHKHNPYANKHQFRNNGPYRGNQYQNQQWNNQRANQGRQRLSSQDQHQDVDMDRPSNFNQGRNFNQGNQNSNRGGYNQRGGRQNVHFNNVVSTNPYPDDEDEDMSEDKYDSDDEYDTEDEDMSEDQPECEDEPEYKYKQTESNNFKQPKKFQRVFRDIGIDTEMTDAPSDEPVRLNLTPFFRYNPNLTTFFGHPSIRFTDHYQSDIEMVDAPALITDPVGEFQEYTTLSPWRHSLRTFTNQSRSRQRIKAFAEGAQALQHIVRSRSHYYHHCDCGDRMDID